MMGWSYRRSKKLGPLRLTVSRRGLSASGGTKRARIGGSTTGRRSASFNFGHGLRWMRSLRRKRRR